MDQDTAAIFGAISAQRFILQNIYALILAQNPDPVLSCRDTAREMRRQFEDLPPTNQNFVPSDEAALVRQHGLAHLERF